jgi:hypothetical protein
MRLADLLTQCRTPFVVKGVSNNALTRLNGAADFAKEMATCPTRYVLSDDLTRLCTALAYSKGARNLECADLLRVPAQRVWVEWCEAPWQKELAVYGFDCAAKSPAAGRRGALIRSSDDGRRGLVRTFWSAGDTNVEVLASSMEAYFDLDSVEGQEPESPAGERQMTIRVSDGAAAVDADIVRRCFRFRYEATWAAYYAGLRAEQKAVLARHALGTIALDIPVLLAFFLLLATRTGLPCRTQTLDRLNRSRANAGKVPLLDHIEVFAPLLPEYSPAGHGEPCTGRRAPRLHHVRGHLVRRGSQLFWRVPHLRGNARSGAIASRTVTWTVDRPPPRSGNEITPSRAHQPSMSSRGP